MCSGLGLPQLLSCPVVLWLSRVEPCWNHLWILNTLIPPPCILVSLGVLAESWEMLEHSEVSNKWPHEETAVWPFCSVVSLTCQMTGELGVNLRPDFSLFFLYSRPNVAC